MIKIINLFLLLLLMGISPIPFSNFRSIEAALAILDSPTGQVQSSFGFSVAISGDYAVVAAQYENAPNTDSGQAYIFYRNGSNWAFQATLVNPTGEANSYFGHSVAISGDYAIIGAYQEDVTTTNQGQVYIFFRTGTTWALQATIVSPTAEASAFFGSSVGISGNYAIIGAYGEDDAAVNTGISYIYFRTGTTWALQSTLVNPTGEGGSFFGWAASIFGDYAIVGAQREDTPVTDGGQVYIYFRTGTTWTLQSTLKSPANGPEFGQTVSISGDYAIVGASLEDVGNIDTGQAYIFFRTGATWALQATIANPTAEYTSLFGCSVAISGDYAVVGAYRKDLGMVDAGQAYIYHRVGTTWTLISTVLNPTPIDGDGFGWSVAISGSRFIIGATGADGKGQAYIYNILNL